MRRYLLFVVFVILVAGGMIISLVVAAGYYPIAMVDGTIVSAHAFREYVSMSEFYYRNLRTTYSRDGWGALRLPEEGEVEPAVLGQLIQDIMVDKGVRRELGDDFQAAVDYQLGKIRRDRGAEEAVRSLYGTGFGDFEEKMIFPIAEREALAGRLFLKNKSYEEWLSDAKKASKVRIFSSRWYWDGTEVRTR